MKQLVQKTYWLLAAGILLSGVLTACSTASGSQATANNNVIPLLQERRFVFIPHSVLPTGGRNRQLTSDFSLLVSGDTIQSYLPYFGRAFTAPISPGQGGMNFTITNYEYNMVSGKNGRQEITIKPREGTDVRQMTLQVYPDGNASLQALSNNRQAISYNGHVEAPRRR